METKSSNLSVLLEEGVKRGRVKMDIETEIRWAYLIFAIFITLTHLETWIFYTQKYRYKGQGRFCENTTFFYRIFFGTLPSVESMTTNIYAVCCTLPSIQSLYKKEHFIFVQTWPRQESKLTNTSSLEELEKSVLWNSTETTRTNALS